MKKTIYSLTAVLLALSCTDDMEISNGNNGQQDEKALIQFTVDDSQDWYLTGNDVRTTRAKANGAYEPKTVEMLATDGSTTGIKMTARIVNGIEGNGLAGKAVTRGIQLNALPGNFKLHAYTYDNSGQAPTWISYFYDQLAFNNGSSWQLQTSRYWPLSDTQYLRFYGYAPTDDDSGITLSQELSTAAPYLDFTVNPLVRYQKDLMIAVTGSLRHSPNLKVELPFRHALTCVKFALGDDLPASGTIKSITLENIVGAGRYYYETGWTPSNLKTDTVEYAMNSLAFNFTSAMLENQIIAPIADGGASATTLLMIPQRFTNELQRVKVVYNTGGDDITAYATLNGQTWLPGTSVTYYLSTTGTSEYVLNVSSGMVSHNGGEGTFAVRSYRQVGENYYPVGWRVTGYSIDGTNFTIEKPAECSWVGIMKTAGNGGVEAEQCRFTADAQTGTTEQPSTATDNTDTQVMKAYMSMKNPRGEMRNPIDLSTHDINGNPTLRNTANCYVINAPGWYKIPLIYGNAYKNGIENKEAMTSGSASLKYKDYLDQDLEQPFIYETAAPGAASLVWQDVDGLITPATVMLCDSVNGKATALKFRIPNSNTTFQQGNAIVAVLDNASPNKRIMWSWHIWVTDVDIHATIPVVNHYRKTFHFMPVNLGWCSLGSGLTHYPGRTLYVRITQDGGKESVIPITQVSASSLVSESGYNPFWQAGRKDPMQPGKGTAAENRNVYGTYQPDYTITSKQTIGHSIQHPNYMYCVQQSNWHSPDRFDLWCANTASIDGFSSIVKSIYDPSPVGFKMPDGLAFTGFTSTGAGSSASGTTLYSEKYSNGFYLYANSNSTETIYFPITGVHDTWTKTAASVIDYWNNGQSSYWTGCHTGGKWYYLWIMDQVVSPIELYYCGSRGMCVRPVADY